MMRQFLLTLLLLPLTMAISYDNVWKMFHFSQDDVGHAMPDTKLDRKLDQGLVLMKDLRKQLQSGLPNEDVRTNVFLNLEGI